jgi:hypothetical protein
MGYIIIIVIAVLVISWFAKNRFLWKTVIFGLWKEICIDGEKMGISLKDKSFSEDETINFYKKRIDFRGNVINSILDYINYFKKEKDEEAEKETFGYGRYDFKTILYLAKSDPNSFKNFKK